MILSPVKRLIHPMEILKILVMFAVVGGMARPPRAEAWDYEGHRLIARLALHSLPPQFPAFVRSPEAMERVAFLSGEPDRWRNTTEPAFAHVNKPDHFFDIDELEFYGLTVITLSPFRYEADAQFAAGRAANAHRFPRLDPAKDPDFTRGRIGFLPWTITEHQGRLKSSFSYLRAFEEGGTPEETANARQNVLYTMGLMAHVIGDAVQPLHTTRHFNGWVGSNPNGYTTNRTFHSWVDGGFPARLGLEFEALVPRLRQARRLDLAGLGASSTNLFPAIIRLIQRGHEKVEPLYQLDRDGKLSGRMPSAEGREFVARQMVEGAQMLADLWTTAWQDAPQDFYLKAQLARRRLDRADQPGRPADGVKPSE
jgi:hypothetical protein